MARNLFGGSSDDYAADSSGRPITARRVRFYTSVAMSTEITDLASDAAGTGAPLTVSTDSRGYWGPVYGPDAVTVMYAGTVDAAGNPPTYVVAVYTHTQTGGGGASGVATFNGRTGAVSLSKADVTGTGLAATDVAADASGAAATAQTAAQTYADTAVASRSKPRGAWAPTTAYAVNDVVTSGGAAYRCLVAHTSGASFSGAGTNWEAWGNAASGLSGGGAWATGTAYTAGTEVVQGGVNYAAVTAHTSGTFATDLAAGKWVETGVNSASAVSLSNTVPPRPGTPAAGTATTARRGDAVQGSFGLFMFYGDGRNGAATFDGATAVTGFARAGSVYTSNQATFFTNVTVNSGVTVICQAPMHVSGTLTNNGTMQMNGTDASGNGGGAQVQVNQWFDRGGPAGNGATGAGAAGSFRSVTTGGGGQGGAGGSGNAGANAGGTTSGTNMTLATGTQQAEQPLGSPLFAFWGLLMVTGSALGVSGGGGGGGGGGDGTNSGGGGGSGAGVLVVNANILAGSGAFQANGGKGANGTGGNAGGGGGGGGGVCLVNTTDATGWSGTTTATGGAGGTGVGTGANGVTGTAGYASLKTWV